jgi:cell division protein FtsB
LITRQTRNSRRKYFVVPVISLLLLAYFGFHAWSGRYGIESMRRLDDEAVRLQFELAAIKLKRQALEARVMLLREGTIERDMLDEQARNNLNMTNPDELVILR